MNIRMSNKKGFTLVELLAVIVVLAIIMMIAVTSVTGILEKSRRNAFALTATAFVDAVRNDAILNARLPDCGDSKNYFLTPDILEKGGKESPFGNPYVFYNRYILVSNLELKEDGIKRLSNIRRMVSCDICDYQQTCISCTNLFSYVIIDAINNDITNNCDYEYSILLYDGEYVIGDTSNENIKPINANNISGNDVQKRVSVPQNSTY